MPIIDEWFQYLLSLSDKKDELIVNQSELSTNTQCEYGSKVHDDLEVIKKPHFLSTSQEQHDILQDTVIASDISLPTMYFSIEEGTLN
jgi:hypothetical protein